MKKQKEKEDKFLDEVLLTLEDEFHDIEAEEWKNGRHIKTTELDDVWYRMTEAIEREYPKWKKKFVLEQKK